MTQSSDIQHGIDYMIQLRDKLCKNSIESRVMDKTIARYQNKMALVELRNDLVYKAPRGFHNIFIEELSIEEKTIKQMNCIKYLILGAYIIFVLYMVLVP